MRKKTRPLRERVYAIKFGEYYMAVERGRVVPLVHPNLPVSKDRARATHFANRDEAQRVARSCGAKLVGVPRRRKPHGRG